MINKEPSLRSHATKGGKWTAVSATCIFTFQLVQLVVLGRLLGTSDFGLMAILMVVIGLANSIADFGLGNYLVQVKDLCLRSLVILMSIAVALSLSLMVVVALSAEIIAEYYSNPQLAEFLPWLSISIVASCISQMQFSLLQRFFEFKTLSVSEMASVFLSTLAVVILAIDGYGVWALIIGQLILPSAKAVFLVPNFLAVCRRLPKNSHSDLWMARKFTFYQTGERILNYIAANMDKAILGRMVGEAGLGLYSLAFQIMTKPFMIINPIVTRVALPTFSYIKNDDARLSSGYLEALRLIGLATFPIYLALAIAAPGIIHITIGEKWSDAAPILSVLSVLGMLFSIGNPLGSLIIAKGKPHYGFIFNLISLLVYAVAFTVGARYGAIGVAWAFLLSSLFILFPVEFVIRKRLIGMSFFHYYSSMKHLIAGFVLPISAFTWLRFLYGSAIRQLDTVWLGAFAALFFYMYIFVFDGTIIRSGIISLKSKNERVP